MASPLQPPSKLAAETIADALNRRFRDGRPSANLSDAGVLLHSLDGYDVVDAPWHPSWGGSMQESCRDFADGRCAGPGDRVSASFIYHAESKRADRTRIPLFNDAPGFILRPDAVTLLCSYADDGGSQSANCHPPGVSDECVPGCTHSDGYCDPSQGIDAVQDGWCRCSIDWCRMRPQPWAAEDLGLMLQQHQKHGATYRGEYGMNSGYNEVILDGAKWDESLPRTIEAVFIVAGSNEAAAVAGRRVHRDFLAAYFNGTANSSSSNSGVPLLELNQSDWERPFRVLAS